MNRTFLLIGLAIATVMVAAILYLNRGAHLQLQGNIQKVRVHPLDENSALVIADFRVTNPSNTPFVVRSVEVLIDTGMETPSEGATVAEVDAKRLLQTIPELGPRYNPSLIARDRIVPKQTDDRMIAARFEMPQRKVAGRRNLSIRITDVDGTVSLISEK